MRGRTTHGYAPGAPVVEIDSGPLYELLLSLLIFSQEGYRHILQVGPQWFTSVRVGASTALLAALEELSPPCWVWQRLLIMACESSNGSQALHCEQFIERLRGIEADRLYEFILGAEGPGAMGAEIVARARLGEEVARTRLARTLFPDDPRQDAGLRHLLALSPEQVKELVLRILSLWYVELFRGQERELAVRLASEARTKRIIGSSAPTRLLRAAAPGLQYLPRRSITRVILIPALVSRPCVVTIRFNSTRVFFYPVADEAAEEEELQARLVKTHRALGDPVRLRILQELIRAERTLGLVSEAVGSPRGEVAAHLVVLRDAGLVTLKMDERREVFATRPNLPSVLFRTLQAYLPDVR